MQFVADLGCSRIKFSGGRERCKCCKGLLGGGAQRGLPRECGWFQIPSLVCCLQGGLHAPLFKVYGPWCTSVVQLAMVQTYLLLGGAGRLALHLHVCLAELPALDCSASFHIATANSSVLAAAAEVVGAQFMNGAARARLVPKQHSAWASLASTFLTAAAVLGSYSCMQVVHGATAPAGSSSVLAPPGAPWLS